MQPYSFLKMTLILCLCASAGCDKDDIDNSAPVLTLSDDYVTGKSGREIDLTLNLTTPGGFKKLAITKGINLHPDENFGTDGVLEATPVSTGTNTYQYKFSYTLSPDEVDSLVGFNFKLVDNQGREIEKDLTVNTVASPEQILFSYKWLLKSKFQATQSPGVETITDCESDDVYTWNRDHTMSINYGSKGCTFDGFNVYDSWSLSENEKEFTQIYHSLFDPSNITVEKYNVRSISKDRVIMDVVLDLSVFGPPYTDHEVFVYTFDAVQ